MKEKAHRKTVVVTEGLRGTRDLRKIETLDLPNLLPFNEGVLVLSTETTQVAVHSILLIGRYITQA
jgi:hypothetical protein